MSRMRSSGRRAGEWSYGCRGPCVSAAPAPLGSCTTGPGTRRPPVDAAHPLSPDAGSVEGVETTARTREEERGYPAHWEADVVLRDGGTAHLRPIRPYDAERLVGILRRAVRGVDLPAVLRALPAALRRGRAPLHPRRPCRAGGDRRARSATRSSASCATTRSTPPEAEVAFNSSRTPTRGAGSARVLLEHIAAAARERGITRFVAEVLPGNAR